MCNGRVLNKQTKKIIILYIFFINDKDLIELIPSLTPLSMCELPENRVRL